MDRALRQFLAVAETGSITAAAERLHITQPTITVSIRKLEDDYGVGLFERSSRGMQLTDYGAVLYNHARGMARLEQHARDEIAARLAGTEASLRIGCGDAWWLLFVRDLVEVLQRERPRREVHVEISSSFDGIAALLSGDVSIFVGHQVPQLKPNIGMAFEPLFEIDDGFYTRAGHPLLGKPCRLAEIQTYDAANIVPVKIQHRLLLGPLTSAEAFPIGSRPNRRVVSSNALTACLDLMKASDAILQYPAVTDDFFAAQGIERLDVINTGPAPIVGLYMSEENQNDSGVVATSRRIRAAARAWQEHRRCLSSA